jgi:hypothetical protein
LKLKEKIKICGFHRPPFFRFEPIVIFLGWFALKEKIMEKDCKNCKHNDVCKYLAAIKALEINGRYQENAFEDMYYNKFNVTDDIFSKHAPEICKHWVEG